ncbi:MAG: hypothetical protein LBT26_06470 [Clostridiales Family XIII bacterium]|nr:hypothetical protein [Clostridiales Family XIII bacterium]
MPANIQYSRLQAGFENDAAGAYSGYWPDSTVGSYLNGIDTSDPVIHPHVGKNCAEDSFKTDAFTAEEWAAINKTEFSTAKEWADKSYYSQPLSTAA